MFTHRGLQAVLAGAFICLGGSTAAFAELVNVANASNTITIFNTGVDSSGNPLPAGSIDPHYTITASADPTFTGPTARVSESASGYPFPPQWVADNASSQWISPRAVAAEGNAVGSYTYQTTFNISGNLTPTNVYLTGLFAADNMATIYLNGVDTGITTNNSTNTSDFASFTAFEITSGFVAGTNTLDFVVVNTPNANGTPDPTGLNVEISGARTPEPNSFILLGAGLFLVVLARQRNFARRIN